VALARSRSSFVVHQPPCPQAPPWQCRTNSATSTAPTAVREPGRTRAESGGLEPQPECRPSRVPDGGHP